MSTGPAEYSVTDLSTYGVTPSNCDTFLCRSRSLEDEFGEARTHPDERNTEQVVSAGHEQPSDAIDGFGTGVAAEAPAVIGITSSSDDEEAGLVAIEQVVTLTGGSVAMPSTLADVSVIGLATADSKAHSVSRPKCLSTGRRKPKNLYGLYAKDLQYRMKKTLSDTATYQKKTSVRSIPVFNTTTINNDLRPYNSTDEMKAKVGANSADSILLKVDDDCRRYNRDMHLLSEHFTLISIPHSVQQLPSLSSLLLSSNKQLLERYTRYATEFSEQQSTQATPSAEVVNAQKPPRHPRPAPPGMDVGVQTQQENYPSTAVAAFLTENYIASSSALVSK
jgi:hypothetical protein